MKIITVAILILLAAPFAFGKNFTKGVTFGTYPVKQVLNVVDGDTFDAAVYTFPNDPILVRIRVLGIDTPEKGHLAKCQKERAAAAVATKFTTRWLAAGPVRIQPTEYDNLSRLLAWVSRDGERLDLALIAAGLGRENHGQKRGGWCE